MKTRRIRGRDDMLNEHLEYFTLPQTCESLWVHFPFLLHQVTVFLIIKYSVMNQFGNEGLCRPYLEEVCHVFWVFNFCFLSLICSINSLHDLIILNSEGFENSKQPCKSDLKTFKVPSFISHKCQTPQATRGLHKGNNPTSLFCSDGKHFSSLSDLSEQLYQKTLSVGYRYVYPLTHELHWNQVEDQQ